MTTGKKRLRILSGVQPSGKLHLGNYFGAVKQHIALQTEAECFYFIANYHALTTIQDADTLRENTRDVALDYLALGLDPNQAAFFRQSDVPEVTELTWILGTVTNMGLVDCVRSNHQRVESRPLYREKGTLELAPFACRYRCDRDAELASGTLQILDNASVPNVVRINQHANSGSHRKSFVKEFKALSCDFGTEYCVSSDIGTGFRQTFHKSCAYRISNRNRDDCDGLCCLLGGKGSRSAGHCDHIDR